MSVKMDYVEIDFRAGPGAANRCNKCVNTRSPGLVAGWVRYIIWMWTCVVLVGQSLPVSAAGRGPHLRYMSNHCSGMLEVDSTLLVALTHVTLLPEVRDTARDSNVHCKVKLRAASNARLIVHFLELHVSPDQKHHDRIKIYDSSPDSRELTPRAGLYGMLIRDQMLEDTEGSKVMDYKSTGQDLSVEYVGVPTKKNSGFQILVTVFRSPNSRGLCPRGYLQCGVDTDICVPASSVCDGFNNCGLDDLGDETNCDSYETVTNVMDHYSLAYDIVMMVLLPLTVFLLWSIAVYCYLRRHIRLKITIQTEPAVRYSAANGGHAKLKLRDDKVYAPPSYQDVMDPSGKEGGAYMMAPPPAYSSLVREEDVDSDENFSRSSQKHYRYRDNRHDLKHYKSRDGSLYDSTSSIDLDRSSPYTDKKKYHDYVSRPSKGSHEVRGRHSLGARQGGSLATRISDTDDDDDEEVKVRQGKRKGGKSKRTVHKRRADDLAPGANSSNGHAQYGDVGPCDRVVVEVEERSCRSLANIPDQPQDVRAPIISPSTSSLPSYEAWQKASSAGQSPASSGSPASSPPHKLVANYQSSLPPQTAINGNYIPGSSASTNLPNGDKRSAHNPFLPQTYTNLQTAKTQTPAVLSSPFRPFQDGENHRETNTPSNPSPKTFASPSMQQAQQPIPVTSSVPCDINSSPSTPPSLLISTRNAKINGASPSPSSSSTTDQEVVGPSETESRSPSHSNSRTESNGSIHSPGTPSPLEEKPTQKSIPESSMNGAGSVIVM